MVADLRSGQYWWVYAVAGVVSILFGLAAILWPHLTLFVLATLFAAFAIVDGILQPIAMFRAIGTQRMWWPPLVIGIVDIAAGLFILANPGISAILLAYAIAFWAIIVGLFEIVGSLVMAQFRLVDVGILSVVFGVVLLGNPFAGSLALVVVIGIFAIVRGIVLLIHAFHAPEMPAMPT